MAEVYLFDMLHAVGDGLRGPIITQLNGYFKQLHGAGGPLMRCWWWRWDPEPSGMDILVYFVPFGKSVVRKLYPNAPSPISGHDGLTTGKNPRASEVYVKTSDPDILAKLTFHEIMHMKLRMGNEMHDLRGLASAVVTDKTNLSKDNIRLMAKALRTQVDQWTGGIQIMAQTIAASSAGDPLSDILE